MSITDERLTQGVGDNAIGAMSIDASVNGAEVLSIHASETADVHNDIGPQSEPRVEDDSMSGNANKAADVQNDVRPQNEQPEIPFPLFINPIENEDELMRFALENAFPRNWNSLEPFHFEDLINRSKNLVTAKKSVAKKIEKLDAEIADEFAEIERIDRNRRGRLSDLSSCDRKNGPELKRSRSEAYEMAAAAFAGQLGEIRSRRNGNIFRRD